MKYDTDSIIKRKRINKNISKLIYAFVIIILYNFILLSVSYIDKFETPNDYKYKAYIIVTDSMYPEIKSGDIIIIEKTAKENIKVGSIVTFKEAGQIITHRVIAIDNKDESKTYITKGDNNNVADEKSVKYEDIEGTKVLRIPFLGKIMSVLKSGIIIILIILLFLIYVINKIGKEEKKRVRREKKRNEDRKNKKISD